MLLMHYRDISFKLGASVKLKPLSTQTLQQITRILLICQQLFHLLPNRQLDLLLRCNRATSGAAPRAATSSNNLAPKEKPQTSTRHHDTSVRNMRFLLVAIGIVALSAPVFCDVYMHNPRGSNNRCLAHSY